MRVKFWTLGLLIFVGGALSRNYKPRTQLTFSPTSRGYTNVLVAINSNVNEADCVQVVQEVKVNNNYYFLIRVSSVKYFK